VDVPIFMSFYLESCIWPDAISLRILTAGQKQQRVNGCKELQITSNDAIFLSRVITGDQSWTYGYDPETQQQSSKSPNSLRPKKMRQVKSKVKSMLIIFFDIKGIAHNEFVLPGQTVNSAFSQRHVPAL
jgi:hypothetical protein